MFVAFDHAPSSDYCYCLITELISL